MLRPAALARGTPTAMLAVAYLSPERFFRRGALPEKRRLFWLCTRCR